MGVTEFNQGIIEEFGANAGVVGGPFKGGKLLLLHSTGAKSEPARSALYDCIAAQASAFAEYREKTTRVIPIVRLTRTEG